MQNADNVQICGVAEGCPKANTAWGGQQRQARLSSRAGGAGFVVGFGRRKGYAMGGLSQQIGGA